MPQCAYYAWHLASTYSLITAGTLRTHEANEIRRVAHLSRLRFTAASKTLPFALRVRLFALATGAIIDAERRARDARAVPRDSWRTHTFRTLIFGKPMRPRISFAARGNFTE